MQSASVLELQQASFGNAPVAIVFDCEPELKAEVRISALAFLSFRHKLPTFDYLLFTTFTSLP